MNKYGTLAFLLRWHLGPFVVGLGFAAFATYQLLTHEPEKSSAITAVITAPSTEFFVPLMWFGLVLGMFLAGRAVLTAWRHAHPG